MNARHFTLLNENPFWNDLQSANASHVTAQQKYNDLVNRLVEARVAFVDVRNFMINEAKRAGLLQKVGGVYSSNKQLKRENSAWFVSLLNFGAWLNYNYDGSFSKQITSEDRKNKAEKKKAEKSQKKTATITRSENGEVRTDVVETTVDMDSPVENSLTADQVASIVLNNPDVWAGEAEMNGAEAEFNAFMKAIGRPEDCIALEEEEEVVATGTDG